MRASIKPGFHMVVTVGNASPRQARGHIGDHFVKWKHFLNDVADQTGTVRGRIERVEMGFNMIIAVIVSIYRRLIGDTSPMCCSRSPTVTIIWKPGLNGVERLSEIEQSKAEKRGSSPQYASVLLVMDYSATLHDGSSAWPSFPARNCWIRARFTPALTVLHPYQIEILQLINVSAKSIWYT